MNQEGRIARVRVLRGPTDSPEFQDHLVRQLSRWRFEPARLRGEPVAVFLRLDLRSARFTRSPPDG